MGIVTLQNSGGLLLTCQKASLWLTRAFGLRASVFVNKKIHNPRLAQTRVEKMGYGTTQRGTRRHRLIPILRHGKEVGRGCPRGRWKLGKLRQNLLPVSYGTTSQFIMK